MAFTFDGPAKRITVGSGISSFDAGDLYAEWKEWILLDDNAKYSQALSTIGGDDIGGGQSVSAYYFVINNWEIKPDEADHTLTISGNLLADGGGSPFISTTGAYNVRIVTIVTSNSITTAGGGGGGSDPWATEIPGSYNDGEAGQIVGEELLRITSFLALKNT